MPLRTLIKAKREVGLCVLELLCLERTPNRSAVLQLVSANKMSEGLRDKPGEGSGILLDSLVPCWRKSHLCDMMYSCALLLVVMKR